MHAHLAELRPEDVAMDADRTPRDPERVAGAETPDPWDEDPDRWRGTEPVQWPS